MADPNTPAPEAELQVDTVGTVRILTLNRLARSNSLTLELMDGLRAAFDEALHDADVAALVLTGAGHKAFCAGADIKTAQQRGSGAVRGPMAGSARMLREMLLETWKPIIAAVGGGLELALACDIRLCDPAAIFALPEAKRGMGAHFASVLLPQLIARTHAMKMLYLGDSIDAAEAERIGLVSIVSAPGQVRAEALDLATRIAANAPISLRRIKETGIKAAEGLSPYSSEDRIEGFRAFTEKRAPEWKGR